MITMTSIEKPSEEDTRREPEKADESQQAKDGSKRGHELGPHDVLLGRGLGTYNHVGNVNYRKLVAKHKVRYVSYSKAEKPKIARELVQLWRKMDPPGRFLARKEPPKKGEPTRSDESQWHEVGDKRAQEKTSQCLRERTPDVMPFYNLVRAAKKERQTQVKSHAVLQASNLQNGVALQQQALQLGQLQNATAGRMDLGQALALQQEMIKRSQQQQQSQMMVPLNALLQREQALQEREAETLLLRRKLALASLQYPQRPVVPGTLMGAAVAPPPPMILTQMPPQNLLFTTAAAPPRSISQASLAGARLLSPPPAVYRPGANSMLQDGGKPGTLR